MYYLNIVVAKTFELITRNGKGKPQKSTDSPNKGWGLKPAQEETQKEVTQ